MPETKYFTLYQRSACHLCEDMLSLLLPYQQSHGIEIELIDIDSNPQLQQRYGTKIPVLTYQDQEVCHYYFDQEGFLGLLNKI